MSGPASSCRLNAGLVLQNPCPLPASVPRTLILTGVAFGSRSCPAPRRFPATGDRAALQNVHRPRGRKAARWSTAPGLDAVTVVCMARFKLCIEYAGTRYSGWQIQKNARTIQGEIDRALREVTGERTFELYGSGRTDAGVHALEQVAHLDLATALPPATLRRRLNDALPSDISILTIEPAPPRFHARHGAVARSYLYQIARRRTAFAKSFVWWVKDDLDLSALRAAGAAFVGMQDFRSFTDDRAEGTSTLVAVEAVEVGEDGDLVLIRVEGSALPVEDGAAHGRGHGRGGERRAHGERRRAIPGRTVRETGRTDRAAVRAVPRAGLLSGGAATSSAARHGGRPFSSLRPEASGGADWTRPPR